VSKPAKVSPLKLSGRPGFLVQTPYDEFFIEQLKAMIPRGDRWFNAHRKGWWVAEEHSEMILHLVREAFGAIIVVDEDGREITHERSGEKLEQGRFL
jgi:hypothetical protein